MADAALSFDDLIPAGQPRTAGAGLSFDDLVPGAGGDAPKAPPWTIEADPKIVKGHIDKLPEFARDAARQAWADAAVARDRAGGGALQSVDDAVRRFSSHVPGVGPWADQANAYTAYLGGHDYDMAHAYEKAKDRAVDKADTTVLATTPKIRLPLVGEVGGEISPGGLEKTAGAVIGGLALPFGKAVEGGGALATGANVGLNAAGYGALEGLAKGDTLEERLKNAVESGAISGTAGAALGGVLGKLSGPATQAGKAETAASNATAEAAQKVGVELPNVAAGTANSPKMVVGAMLKELPWVGTPLVEGAAKAKGQIEEAAGKIADQYAPLTTPMTAGDAARQGISDWITKGSSKTLEAAYDEVGKQVPQAAWRPLSATRNVVQQLLTEDKAAASEVNAKATKYVEDAISRPEGLTYNGLRQLRTNLGNMINDSLLPEAGTIKPALKRLYGGLSEDLENTVKAFGGDAAQEAWRKANTLTRVIEAKREALTRVVGLDGRASPEAVLDNIVRMAGSRSTADLKGLLRVRNILPPEAWDGVASQAISRLGRDQSNNFSPAIFLKNFSALTPNGKATLFGSGEKGVLKDSLDALAKTTEAYGNLQKLANSSGTGRAMIGIGAIMGSGLQPMAIPFIALKALGGRMISQSLSKPVAVKQLDQFSQRLYNVLESGQGDAALRLSTITLAHAIAKEVGGDEKTIAAQIQQGTNDLLQGRAR